ncbi:MAG: 4-hydroxy-3-methylbut-2-enyl diphosphate reductase [Paludibacteraceae bacterium]|nr:4-hydroxy-3-methylbut-2-enyl diphosphate reductase [Paludibacteraceae bacterium]
MPLQIEIDPHAGFCFGVVNAIQKAEQALSAGERLYCLGDIVHNEAEVARLAAMGLRVVDHEAYAQLHDSKVLLRAHGEPPSTYRTAEAHRLQLLDATCPVVLQLQRRISQVYRQRPQVQIAIYGKYGHAEVNGLVGQTEGKAVVLEQASDVDRLDPERDTVLFSQTTKSGEGYEAMIRAVRDYLHAGTSLEHHDTICRQVAGRMRQMREFAQAHDVVLFVCGAKSSNGRILMENCRRYNPHTYFVSSVEDVRTEWLEGVSSVGISGATSTALSQMEELRNALLNRL